MKLKWIGFISAIVLVISLVPSSVRADVHDNANIFGQSAVDDATRAMKKMERVHNKQLVVETFAVVPDDQKAAAQSDPEGFVKKWLDLRAQQLKVNGVFVLICMDPHRLEVAAGKNTLSRGDFTEEDIDRLKTQLKSDLHDKNYDKALGDAVDIVERDYTANITSAAGRSAGGGETEYSNGGYHNSGQTVPSVPHGSGGMGFSIGSLICLGVAAVIIISLIKSIFRGNGGSGYGGGVNYPQGGQNYGQNYGGGGGGFGYGNMGGGGGGFGRGFLGGLLGGALGGYAADKFDHRNDQSNAGFPQNDNSGNFGGGGGGGSFDSGPSDAGQGFGDSASGADFGGGGGDSGGGGGDSSGGDF